jgi:hypothetical protein
MDYVPGLDNSLADMLSRVKRDNSDWKLHPELFQRLCTHWGRPQIDLFATRANAQLDAYFSRHPDPSCLGVDAFAHSWSPFRLAYANPPFQIVAAVLRKVREDRAELIIVLPLWRTAAWWPTLLGLLRDIPNTLPKSEETFLPGHLGSGQGMGPPPWESIACRISGDPGMTQAFQRRLCDMHNSARGNLHRNTLPEPGTSFSCFATALESTPWPPLRP